MTGASLQLTVERARKIPPVVDVPTAAAILGIGRPAAYELIRVGSGPPRSCVLATHPGAQRSAARTGGRFPMKHGSVAQIHTRSCPRAEDGSFTPHRCKGSWRYTLGYGRDNSGQRMQTSKAGFPTKGTAQAALQELVRTLMTDVHLTSLTVEEYLETWLTSKHALKPTTMTLYSEFTKNYPSHALSSPQTW